MSKVRLSLLILCFVTVGCSSYFKRKDCEKTNWFQHGHNVAMKGQRLNADDFVQQCEKVEAKIDYGTLDLGFKDGMGNYCKPQTVYNTGKKGEAFKEDLCDGSPIKKLLEQHKEGLKVFCQPQNAQMFGAQGGIYKDVCPKELEDNFLLNYRKGRIVFLQGLIDSKKAKMVSVKQINESKKRDKEMTSLNLSNMRGGAAVTSKRSYNPKTKKYVKQTVVQEDIATQNRRRDLEMKLNSLDREIRSNEKELERLQTEILEHQQEINALQLQAQSN